MTKGTDPLSLRNHGKELYMLISLGRHVNMHSEGRGHASSSNIGPAASRLANVHPRGFPVGESAATLYPSSATIHPAHVILDASRFDLRLHIMVHGISVFEVPSQLYHTTQKHSETTRLATR